MSKLEKLSKELQILNNQKAEIIKKARNKAKELERERAIEKIKSMPEEEVEALKQVISETGKIKSGEKVSGLKAKK